MTIAPGTDYFPAMAKYHKFIAMLKATPYRLLLVPAIAFLFFLTSCNNRPVDIPFPISDSGYPQPASIPLQFSAPKKLKWVTLKTGAIRPSIRKLDLSTMPSTPYDTAGFKPFDNVPIVTHVNFNSLPDTAFNLDKISSKSLNFRIQELRTPSMIKTGAFLQKGNAKISISDWGSTMGLLGQYPTCEFWDRSGFLWFSTDKGIYRFDGEYLRSYGSQGASGIVEDSAGRIWFINPYGFGMYDVLHGLSGITDQITALTNRAPKMYLDDQGRIWVTQTADRGFDIIYPSTGKFKHIDKSNGINGTYSWGVCQTDKNNFWLGATGGITIMNTAKNTIRYLNKKNGLFSDSVRAMAIDQKGIIWMAFRNGGLSSVNEDSGTVTNYGSLMDNSTTYQVSVDYKDRIWVPTSHGLAIYDPETNTIKRFGDEQGVPRDIILHVLFDQKKRAWLALYNGGVSVIDQDFQMAFDLDKKNITTSYIDEYDKVWAGTAREGIFILDGNKKTMVQLDKQVGLTDNTVQSIQDFNGQIWITSDGGLDIIDQTKKIVEHTGRKEGLLTDSIYTVLKDGKDNIWISGPAAGLELIDSAKTKIMRVTMAEGLSDNTVTAAKEDNNGRIWIATLQGGVDLIDLKDSTIQYLNKLPGLRDTCSRVLLPDQYGRMWIGTDKGIYVVDQKLSTIYAINKENGLTHNTVTSLLPYKQYVVATTYNKVNIITPLVPSYEPSSNDSNRRWTVSVMAKSDGLSMTANSWDVNSISKKGTYVWGDQGLVILNGINIEKTIDTTYITGLTAMNQPLNLVSPIANNENDSLWTKDSSFEKTQAALNARLSYLDGFHWDSISGPYYLPGNLVIPFDQNYLQFQFTQAHMGRHDSAEYCYILLGIDKRWSSFTTKTYSDNYLNLPPGNYIFKVASKNLNGLWGKPVSFSFSITPPWWKTWWAYGLYIFSVVALIWIFIYYRSKKLLSENRLLEERVLERTTEVKQQAEELSTINHISQALVSQVDLNDLIKLVGDRLRDLFKANIVYIALLDKKINTIRFPYQYGDKLPPLKLGEGLTSKIILTGESLLINKDVTEKTSALGIDRVGIPAASYLGVPIPVGDEIIGVLSIQSTETENRFAEKDKRLLGTIAANVGVAIRKARLFEEVKQANTDADAARKNAEEANAAKSAFLSTVSHELRTPLTSVLGFAKITKKRLEEKIFPITDKSDPKTIKTIEQISNNLGVVISEGERLTNLINDVLDLAKIEAGKMEWNLEPVRVPDVVERAIAATSSLFDQKNLKLDRKMEDNLPEISGDRDKLIQVVVNLLSNAVKFTNTGAVTCSVFQKDGGIVVGITDTGIGIAPEDHGKVFEQFKQVGDTLTDKPKGTGLGLPICKEIVEHHHGKIWLESDLGKGSTFYFMLPIIPTDEKAVRHIHLNDLVRQLKKRMQHSHPAKDISHATILVVDDDDGIRSLLKQELGEAGYNIEEASNGKEAISKIRQVRPDLIILDVMMPEMNGFDAAAILKNDPQTMEIPIIILSVVQDKSRGFRIGVDRYLTKPIDTALLFSEIGDLLEQGKSRKKVMVVDEDNVTVRTLTDVLEAKGYQVVESDGSELVEKAIATQPDIIILNSLISDKHEIVRTLRFEKGLENVLFLIYQ
jgi:signal transduction histidine kinase/DNA-binding response OmpR family regulator/ligand-binding sensor domain-containing protein